jgi:hypothetical protein
MWLVSAMVLAISLLAHTCWADRMWEALKKGPRCKKGRRRFVWTWRMMYGGCGRWMTMGGSLRDQPGQLYEILATVRPLGPGGSWDGLGVLREVQLGPWAAGSGSR